MDFSTRHLIFAFSATLLTTTAALGQRWVADFGAGQPLHYLQDVNGDGFDDALYVTTQNQTFMAPSNGTYFENPRYIGLLTVNGERHFADMNGDGRQDCITFDSTNGAWSVEMARSTGDYLGSAAVWILGHGIGSARRFVGDVDGDGLGDAVIYFAASGSWFVARNLGNRFGTPTRWITSHGIGSQNQLLADCNGDGLDDAVVFFEPTGDWYVSLSSGSAFLPFTLWRSGHGIGSSGQYLADLSGDGRADAMIRQSPSDDWYVARSSAGNDRFNPPSPWEFGFGLGQLVLVGNIGAGVQEDLVGIDQSGGHWTGLICINGAFVRRAAVSSIGTGCAGSNGTPVLAPVGSSAPGVGGTFRMQITGVPVGPRFGVIGFSDRSTGGIPLPLDLGLIGAPGCTGYTSADIALTLFNANWDLPVPNDPAALDALLYLQIFQLDPGVNALGVTTSNALRIHVGE